MRDISRIKCFILDQSKIILILAKQNPCRMVQLNLLFGLDRTTIINSVMTKLKTVWVESPLLGSNIHLVIFTLYPIQFVFNGLVLGIMFAWFVVNGLVLGIYVPIVCSHICSHSFCDDSIWTSFCDDSICSQ